MVIGGGILDWARGESMKGTPARDSRPEGDTFAPELGGFNAASSRASPIASGDGVSLGGVRSFAGERVLEQPV
jgi:hypothetical protein